MRHGGTATAGRTTATRALVRKKAVCLNRFNILGGYMKRILGFALLLALSFAWSIPAKGQNLRGGDSARRSDKATEKRQKAVEKAAKRQQKAMKKHEKAQRKAAEGRH